MAGSFSPLIRFCACLSLFLFALLYYDGWFGFPGLSDAIVDDYLICVGVSIVMDLGDEKANKERE